MSDLDDLLGFAVGVTLMAVNNLFFLFSLSGVVVICSAFLDPFAPLLGDDGSSAACFGVGNRSPWWSVTAALCFAMIVVFMFFVFLCELPGFTSYLFVFLFLCVICCIGTGSSSFFLLLVSCLFA